MGGQKYERQWQMWRLAYVQEKDTVITTEIMQKEYNDRHRSSRLRQNEKERRLIEQLKSKQKRDKMD